MTIRSEPTMEARALLERLRKFGMPGGEDAFRLVRGLRTREQGDMRSAPEAPWVPFTAEQTMEVLRSGFCWEANIRSGRMKSVVVTDAYEEGHGRLVVKLGGLIPVKSAHGPDFDKGEIQRYLGSIVYCPPVLLHHPSLEWVAIGPDTLRVRDLADETGATVDIDLGEDGCPLACRAERPRAIGKRSVSTPWFAICSGPKDWAGLRVPSRLEVRWRLAEGEFAYYRSEITSFELLR